MEAKGASSPSEPTRQEHALHELTRAVQRLASCLCSSMRETLALVCNPRQGPCGSVGFGGSRAQEKSLVGMQPSSSPATSGLRWQWLQESPQRVLTGYGLTELKQLICEVGRASTKAWVGVTIEETPGLRRRRAPTGSSSSQGSLEGHLQALYTHVRTLRLSVSGKLQEPCGFIYCRAPDFPWVVKRAQ